MLVTLQLPVPSTVDGVFSDLFSRTRNYKIMERLPCSSELVLLAARTTGSRSRPHGEHKLKVIVLAFLCVCRAQKHE